MKTPITPNTAYWVALTITTRKYGSCYVHVAARDAAPSSYACHTVGDITFFYSSYGRSLQNGGHKYKVRAYRDGKPVRTNELRTL